MSHPIAPDIIAAAQAARDAWRVPASVSLAQWILESGWGQHMPPGSNNPFGYKAMGDEPSVTCPTHEYVHGQEITIDAAFRVFPSIEAAFMEKGRLIATDARYAKAMAVTGDPDAFANALTGVYATDPDYGAKLIALMTQERLYQYDGPLAPSATDLLAGDPAGGTDA